MKSWLEKNDIEMYSKNNEGKSIAAIDIKPNTYIYSSKEINNKNPKFKIGAIVRKSKYINILPKVTLQIGLKKLLLLKKLKILCRGHMLLMIFMEKKLLERFTKEICKKQIKKNLELKK